MKRFLITLMVLSLFIYDVAAQKKYPEKRFALINAQIVDVDNQSIISGSVLISEGKIAAIRETNNGPFDGYEVVDLENAFLMPGMIDVHTHLNSLASAERALLSGVTTVRSASVPAYQDVSLSEMVSNGQLEGPDMIPAGVYVTPFLNETILADPRLGDTK